MTPRWWSRIFENEFRGFLRVPAIFWATILGGVSVAAAAGTPIAADDGGGDSIFDYGLVSYGEVLFNANIDLTGSGGSAVNVLVDGFSFSRIPLVVDAASSISGDLYVEGYPSPPNLTDLTLDGYSDTSDQFNLHVHDVSQATVLPTFDASAFEAFVGTGAGYGGSTYSVETIPRNHATFTNSVLLAGSYVINSPTTINGVLYLQPGVSLTFNNSVTINGCIVQADSNGADVNRVVFNGPVTQTSIADLTGPDFPAEETALTGSALLMPSDDITFNNSLATDGSVIGGAFIFNNGGISIDSGSMISTEGGMFFNANGVVTVNPGLGIVLPEPGVMSLGAIGSMALLRRRRSV